MGTSSYGTGSIYKSKKALSHFQNLRETHNTLSDSVTSSMMAMAPSGGSERERDVTAGGYSSQDPQAESMAIMTGVSPGSSASSTGRSYQPVIPSPLHAEQHSTSAVHIPRSLPPQLSHSVSIQSQESQTTTRHIIQHSSKNRSSNFDSNDEFNNNSSTRTPEYQRQNQRNQGSPTYQQTTAFSSYPQDRHHNGLRRFTIVDDELDNDPYNSQSDEEDEDNDLAGERTRRPRLSGTRGYASTTIDKGKGVYRTGNSSRSRTRDDGNSNFEQSTAVASGSAMVGTSSTSGASNSASTSTIPMSTSGGGGGVRTSILDDDDSLVFKMSELGGEEASTEPSTPPMTSPILFNRPAITGSGHPVFTTKRLLEASLPPPPSPTTTPTIRRINSSDNVRSTQQHVQSLPYQLDIMHRTTDTKNGDSDSPTSNSSCKSEPTSTTVDPTKHPPYYGRWWIFYLIGTARTQLRTTIVSSVLHSLPNKTPLTIFSYKLNSDLPVSLSLSPFLLKHGSRSRLWFSDSGKWRMR